MNLSIFFQFFRPPAKRAILNFLSGIICELKKVFPLKRNAKIKITFFHIAFLKAKNTPKGVKNSRFA
jgi:hypothetical protein